MSKRKLLIITYLALAVVVALGELSVLPVGIVPPTYALQAAQCLLTVACVPLGLKLKRPWLLAIPALCGAALYYLMMDVSMLYCSLIAAVALLFA